MNLAGRELVAIRNVLEMAKLLRAVANATTGLDLKENFATFQVILYFLKTTLRNHIVDTFHFCY